MFKLFRTLCLLLGFWIATLLLSGAGVSLPTATPRLKPVAFRRLAGGGLRHPAVDP